MSTFTIIQQVECKTLEEANIVAAERLGHDEDYGFHYQFKDQQVIPGLIHVVSVETRKDHHGCTCDAGGSAGCPVHDPISRKDHDS